MRCALLATRALRWRSRLVVTLAAALPVVVVAPVAGASPVSSSVLPASASGCNQRVCIHVTGTGTHVTRWSTTAVLPSEWCFGF